MTLSSTHHSGANPTQSVEDKAEPAQLDLPQVGDSKPVEIVELTKVGNRTGASTTEALWSISPLFSKLRYRPPAVFEPAGNPVSISANNKKPVSQQPKKGKSMASSGELSYHTLSVLVEDKAGVLARVADLFARRGYNIMSLAVAPTNDDRYSRITIVVDVESAPLDQIVKQLFKLINVVEIAELAPSHSVERELLMATVNVPAERRSEVVEIVDIFEGKILAVAADYLTVSLDGSPTKLDDFEALIAEYSIVDLQRSGRIALPKVSHDPTRLTAVS